MQVDQTVLKKYNVVCAELKHRQYTSQICQMIEEAANARGTGIAKRDPKYIINKMKQGQAVIALDHNAEVAGFCYIETWQHGKYAVNSGLIVAPKHRKSGLAKRIKSKAFELSRKKYPNAKLFGLTTSLAVMKINSDLGYRPVTFSELTDDDAFWSGCQSCVNYDILQRMNRKHCLCTGMLFDPNPKITVTKSKLKTSTLQKYERWFRYKRYVLLRKIKSRKLLFI